MITEYKKERLQHDISQLPDHIVGRAEYLKDYFDRNVYEVVDESLNPLIDELAGVNGARNIGAAAFSVIPAGTVQSQLQGLKVLMDNAVWGVPDSCGTNIIQNKAVTKEKLADEIVDRLEKAFYPADCTVSEGGFDISGEIPDTVCTVRFTAPAAYVKGNTLTINGVAYALTMVNGKALGDNAWVAGAVVNLQLDPANKKAFFSGGGADLSFVTAAAENIMQGYIGADREGEPVIGTRTVQVTLFDPPITYNFIRYNENGFYPKYNVDLSAAPDADYYAIFFDVLRGRNYFETICALLSKTDVIFAIVSCGDYYEIITPLKSGGKPNHTPMTSFNADTKMLITGSPSVKDQYGTGTLTYNPKYFFAIKF